MSKSCFDKLDPKPPLITKCIYRVSGADDNSLDPLGTATCTLEYLRKFQQHLWTLSTTHAFRTRFFPQLLHWHGLVLSKWTTSPSRPPIHYSIRSYTIPVAHKSNIPLPPPHILVKTISQVTILARTLAILPITCNNPPNWNATIISLVFRQQLSKIKPSLLYPYLKYLVLNYHQTSYAQSLRSASTIPYCLKTDT